MKNQNKQPQEVELGIKKIGTSSFEVTDIVSSLTEVIPNDKYEYGLSFTITPKIEDSIMHVNFTTQLRNKETKEIYCNHTIFIEFEVKNIKDLIAEKNGVYEVYVDAVPLFASVAIGTARGIFSTLIANTNIGNAYIPVIDAAKFVTEAKLIDKGLHKTK